MYNKQFKNKTTQLNKYKEGQALDGIEKYILQEMNTSKDNNFIRFFALEEVLSILNCERRKMNKSI